MNQPQVTIVLPCLNEAASVGSVVREALAACVAAGIAGEVIVADNGSDDGSPDQARAAGARVVDVPLRGYGAALSAGFTAAQWRHLRDGRLRCHLSLRQARGASGSGGARPGRHDRRIALGGHDSRVDAVLASLCRHTCSYVAGAPGGGTGSLTDSQSGFRAMRRQALLDLGLQATGMEYASEMLIVAGRAGWRIREVATGYRTRIGQSKLDAFRDGWRHLRTILLLAPDLAATLPGSVLVGAGALGVGWALVDPDIARAGSPAWLASLLGPAALVLGVQAVLAGCLLSISSPLVRDQREPRAERLLILSAVGGVWALGSGIVLCGALVLSGSGTAASAPGGAVRADRACPRAGRGERDRGALLGGLITEDCVAIAGPRSSDTPPMRISRRI